MSFSRFSTFLALGALSATSALASDFTPYGSVEGWNVFVDNEKKTCLIEKIDDFENVVQMGLTKDRGVAYIGAFTKAETDLKAGQKQAVTVVLGDNFYTGEATMMRGNVTKGYSGGYVLTDDPQVVDDIARQYKMIVFPETAYTLVVDLTGTKKALDMARECNQKQLN